MQVSLCAHRLSRLSRWVLGLWLFALATSWVHGCALQSRTLSEELESAVHRVHDHGPQAAHRQGADAELCIDRCERSALPPYGASPPADPQPPLLAILRAPPEFALLARSHQIGPLGIPPPQGPPLLIRFLRLNR